MIKARTYKLPAGDIILFSLFFGAIGLIILGGFVNWSLGVSRLSRARLNSEKAFQLAEAGLNYYRWHLAHAPQDFQDGLSQPGPYVHEFKDINGNLLGYFSLNITPPPVGSTLVTVDATGYTTLNSQQKRTLRGQFARPSLARFAIVANSDIRFGAGTIVTGPLHSNGGIRFDGRAENLVTSAKSTYDDPDHTGGLEFGVHTHLSPTDPLPPTAVPSRPDVFVVGRQFPVPTVDFDGLASDLATIKSQAIADGLYLAASGYLGYRLVLKTNGQFDLYQIKILQSPPSSWCYNSLNQTGWGTWSISSAPNAQIFLGTYSYPNNGLIFLEDNVWLEGQISNQKLTIASARFPENPNTNTSITVNNNLVYSNLNGNDILSLMAQNNINVGLNSADNLKIDAALVAKNGRIGRYYYGSSCGSSYVRQTLTLNGMLASSLRYGFAYTDSTGYQNRLINYDSNLLYNPPPSFPLTSDQYSLIDWQEIKPN
ncbi:hypothetical protein KKC17_00235 [Patescibacteria group bacterium]|nr:hypothetical protein [Patescibacteria group bacterium]